VAGGPWRLALKFRTVRCPTARCSGRRLRAAAERVIVGRTTPPQPMRILRAQTRATIFGTHNSWSLSWHRQFEKAGTECTVRLEIQGDEKNGYHLVKSPEGFFAADDWHQTLGEAQRSARELFGVDMDQWRED
jgi:hypothetical protein